MTPKEKAEELVNKYKPFVYPYMGSSMLTNSHSDSVILHNAKACAMMAVDEILTVHCLNAGWGEGGVDLPLRNDMKPYWGEVKKEILNIEK